MEVDLVSPATVFCVKLKQPNSNLLHKMSVPELCRNFSAVAWCGKLNAIAYACETCTRIPSGIGCLVWNRKLLDTVKFVSGGKTLSLRFARFELSGSKRIKITTGITLSLSVFLILVLAGCGCWRYRMKQNGSSIVSEDNVEGSWKSDLQSQDVSGLNFFDIHTLQTATNSFSMLNKLGQGGFGTVYKRKLEDGKEIAVNRLCSSSVQGKEEFMNEIKLISKLQLRNLVQKQRKFGLQQA